MPKLSYTEEELLDFVVESNCIEDIHVRPNLKANRKFLDLATPTLTDLVEFVWDEAGKRLRTQPGMNVQIGNHLAPLGGPEINPAVQRLVQDAKDNVRTPFEIHRRYETLHPFMDGNGRSGRILWAWQMLHHDISPGLKLGFLHAFYYQTLAAYQGRPNA